MYPRVLLVVALVVSAGHLASSQTVSVLESPCYPVINFFPTYRDIQPSEPITTVVYDEDGNATTITCKGVENCAYPEPIFLNISHMNYMPSLQTAVLSGGALQPGLDTNINNGLLKVMLPLFGLPRLFFTVSSPLLTTNSDVTACIPTVADSVAVRRMLGAKQTNVSQEGSWSFTTSLDGGEPLQGVKNGKAGEIKLPTENRAVGDHCITLRVNISGYQLTPASGPYAQPSVVRKICWYKSPVSQAEAKLKFDMCSTRAFTVNVSGILPLAQNLTQDGNQVLLAEDSSPALLFRPVLQLFGRKSRDLDGTPVADDAFDSTQDGYNFINRYIIPDTNITSDTELSFILDEDILEEGFYNMSAKISMISDFGNLLADGLGKGFIQQTDVYGAAVQGRTEVMSNNMLVYKEIGVQKSPTKLSEISSDKLNKAIQAGDSITFTWNFAGVKGVQNCRHGETLLPNCVSPVTVKAKDVAAAETKVTFLVEFTDVCGALKKAEYSYTQTGVTAVSKVDVVAGDTAINKGTPTTRGTSSATSACCSLLTIVVGSFIGTLLSAARVL